MEGKKQQKTNARGETQKTKTRQIQLPRQPSFTPPAPDLPHMCCRNEFVPASLRISGVERAFAPASQTPGSQRSTVMSYGSTTQGFFFLPTCASPAPCKTPAENMAQMLML